VCYGLGLLLERVQESDLVCPVLWVWCFQHHRNTVQAIIILRIGRESSRVRERESSSVCVCENAYNRVYSYRGAGANTYHEGTKTFQSNESFAQALMTITVASQLHFGVIQMHTHQVLPVAWQGRIPKQKRTESASRDQFR
jgi:hypothetical protein